jgi:GGDEF domain-containing protein
MNAVFEQTLAEPREPASVEPGSGGSLKGHLLSLRRHAAARLAQLGFRLGGRAPGRRLLSDKSALFTLGDQRLREARHAGRALSLALFQFRDLKEVRSIYGSGVKRELIAQVAEQLAAAAGSRGLVARTAANEFALLLPGADRNKAAQAISRAMGNPVRIEIESDDHEIVLVPEYQIECAGTDFNSVEELYRELCLDLKEARRLEQDREQYLTRERERHSRPVGLGLRPGDPDALGPGADVPPTVPDSLHPR